MIENVNEQENMILNVHQVGPDGTINETVKIEIDPSVNIVSDSTYTEVNNNISNYTLNWEFQEDDKIRFHFPEEENPTLTVIKVEVDGELNQTSYATQINSTTNSAEGPYVFTETKLEQINYLNLPNTAVISCQNCEKKFTTKYHYQRHTCEFNAEKVVLKPEVIGKDINKAIRMKYECDICKKSFISNSNLERHKNCHKNSNENACEHCNKTFVTENRLKIHKENHCKKTGDTTKFYRSDVAVWRCEKCKQVFASETAGRTHVSLCVEVAQQQTEEKNSLENNDEKENNSPLQNNNNENNVENNMSTESETKSNISVLIKTITEMLFQCEFCNRTYASKGSVLEHQQNHTTEKNYECISCEQHFDNFTAATEHWQNKCSNDLNLFYLPRLLYCEVCDKTFKSHEILYNHKNKKKHFVPKICKVKENKTDTEIGLVKMIENMIHTMEAKNQEENNSSLPAITDIKVEDNSEDTSESGKKKRGRKRKYPKPEINNRKLTLGKSCQYQCERCVVCFNDIAAMDKHKETVHATTHKCDQCGQVLQSAKALMIHSRAHQSLKPYVCDQCGRSYSQTSHLWQHMRFHQGIKPFACPHEGCEARYTIRPDLKDHIRKVHTRERPFKCNVCEKSFLTGSVYYQHRLIHTNDRRYGCEICNKRFFRADALNNHRRIHTDERPYPCPVCGREFRQKGDRNKHVRTQHSI